MSDETLYEAKRAERESLQAHIRKLQELPVDLGWAMLAFSLNEALREMSLNADYEKDLFHTMMLGSALAALLGEGLIDLTREQIIARFTDSLVEMIDRLDKQRSDAHGAREDATTESDQRTKH